MSNIPKKKTLRMSRTLLGNYNELKQRLQSIMDKRSLNIPPPKEEDGAVVYELFNNTNDILGHLVIYPRTTITEDDTEIPSINISSIFIEEAQRSQGYAPTLLLYGILDILCKGITETNIITLDDDTDQMTHAAEEAERTGLQITDEMYRKNSVYGKIGFKSTIKDDYTSGPERVLSIEDSLPVFDAVISYLGSRTKGGKRKTKKKNKKQKTRKTRKVRKVRKVKKRKFIA